jgi:hypothetical protein
MDETTTAPETVPTEPVETPATEQPASAVTEALATDTAAPTAGEPGEDPAPATAGDTDTLTSDATQPGADPIDDAPAQDEPVEHPVLTAVRDELSKIANMPAHIWNAVEEAFERVAAKL